MSTAILTAFFRAGGRGFKSHSRDLLIAQSVEHRLLNGILKKDRLSEWSKEIGLSPTGF